MTRTKNSLLNIKVSMAGQAVGLIISFVARIFFIRFLGVNYLGINGLFTNILTMLSLVELGIGPAIIFSLYKPLADKDTPKIQALMQLYKKAYNIIGVLVAVLGTAITPFLHLFIKEMPDVPNISLIFVLFVINSSISYFYAFKRNLIIADQHRYIATVYRYIFFTGLNAMQILFLFLTKNFIVFLVLQIVFTLIENIAVSRKADAMYPFLREKGRFKLDPDTVQQIKKNTGAMVLLKAGSIMVTSMDNILISAKVGILWVGLYSNYQLIMTALNTVVGQFFTSITASIGNLGATESKERSLFIFENIQFANFWIYGFCSICLFELFNPFIELWLGKDLLMGAGVVTILVINFYVRGMRNTALAFLDAFGLYWHIRYKPIFEVIINLTVAVSLAPRFGIAGIFAGMLVSSLATNFWIEPFVLHKKAFGAPLKPYFAKYSIYTLAAAAAGYITVMSCSLIAGASVFAFILKTALCVLIPNSLFLLCFHRTREFRYFWSILKPAVSARLLKRKENGRG